MNKYVFKQESFIGGFSDSSKSGYRGAYQFGEGVDFRSDRDALQAHYRLAKESGSSVTDLIKWMVEYESDVWMYGDTGKIYKRTSVPAYTNPKTVSSSHGNGMAILNTLNTDALWYAGDSSLGKATTLTGTAVFTDDYFKSSSQNTASAYVANAGAAVYAVPTAISETSANKKGFITIAGDTYIEAIHIIQNAPGSGTLTITVHDASNTVVATQTYTAAQLPAAAGTVKFTFNGGFAVTPSTSYHFHVTSSAVGYDLLTNTVNDLSTVRFTITNKKNFTDVDQSSLDSSVVYYGFSPNIKTTFTEEDIDRRTFRPSKTSLAAISVVMSFRSTSDFTLTLHDSKNTVIATKTVPGTNIQDGFGYWFKFEFASPVQLIVGAEYHIHITASTTASYLFSESTNEINSIFFATHYAVLNTDTSYHPMKVLGNTLLIGNGNYLAILEDTEIYDPERLRFPRGEKVRSIEVIGGYAHISTWRYDSITKSDYTRSYIWDGVSPFYRDYLPYNGTINAMQNSMDNQLYVFHNTNATLSIYTGAIDKKRQLKGVENGKYVEIYPGATTIWNNILYYGISAGDSVTVKRGIYAYGKRDNDAPNALSYDYTISTGNKGTTVQIGCLLGLNQSTFLVAWKDGTSYGVDNIDITTKQQDVYFDTLRFDGNKPNNSKRANHVSLRFAPLTATDTITVLYKINKTDFPAGTGVEDGFKQFGSISGATDANVGKVLTSFDIGSGAVDFFEIEFRIKLHRENAATTMPTIYSIIMPYDVDNETRLGAK